MPTQAPLLCAIPANNEVKRQDRITGTSRTGILDVILDRSCSSQRAQRAAQQSFLHHDCSLLPTACVHPLLLAQHSPHPLPHRVSYRLQDVCVCNTLEPCLLLLCEINTRSTQARWPQRTRRRDTTPTPGFTIVQKFRCVYK
jgi:hypothetical protein